MQKTIHIGAGLLAQKDFFTRYIDGHQVMIVTQKSIAAFYLETLQKNLTDYQCDVFFLPEGERYKTLHEAEKVVDKLLEKNHDRHTTLIALGGGIVGDITGFIAACYQRGVNYLQIPTTLIAQVDSAIGGKTGVNHARAKNSIGVFYQPKGVIADIDTLKTLPRREFIAGLAEVIKYALICDADFFHWLEENTAAILNKNSEALSRIIHTCIKHKLRFVEQDEKDRGVRQLLNFGHTFGHALETALAYQRLLHGEAVAMGIVMASELSAECDLISRDDVLRIRRLLESSGLSLSCDILPRAADLLSVMKKDKKNRGGKIQFILLKKIGKAIRAEEIAEEKVLKVIKNYPREKSCSRGL